MKITTPWFSATPRPAGLLAAGLLVVLAGCSSVPSTTPAASRLGTDESPNPEATATAVRIDHPSGSTDVVFRFEEGGGFVPMGFFATEAPIFTLYGDGAVIFRDATAAPPPGADGVIRQTPYQTARLGEDQVQAFLESAIADGGLSVARDRYVGPGADLPTANFTITAGGRTRTVSVMALGMDRDASDPDLPVLQALAALGDRVRNFTPEVDGATTWVPDRWRGVLMPDALNPARDWPWPDIRPADFLQDLAPGAPQFPIRTMTPVEIAALGLADIEGGFSGLSLNGPDGRFYTFALRPLLPDERS